MKFDEGISLSRVGVDIVLISGRTLKQGRGLEIGKLSRDYFEAVSYCELDKTVMSILDVKSGDPIILETIDGEVVVYAKLGRNLEPGMGFIPAGPYANAIISSDTWESGMPDFKGIRTKVFKATDRQVPSVEELLTQIMEE
ncbi:MAG: tRNA CCA-pyrophosphorylase [Candidatus Thorarchaeota archaeon]|nr:tRNA CCA-pyrophosphorylase [Candidatus Thorarchaeota archaeon]